MLPGTIVEQNNRTPDATWCTVGVKVYDARLRKPLLLLFHFTATSKAPEDTNASLEDLKTINKAARVSETYVCTNPTLFRRSLPLIQKLMCVWTQHFSEEAFHLFGSALPILGRTLPICDAAAPQMHVWKSHQMHISSFMHIVIA